MRTSYKYTPLVTLPLVAHIAPIFDRHLINFAVVVPIVDFLRALLYLGGEFLILLVVVDQARV